MGWKDGEDEGFLSVDKFGKDGCPVFNAGFCERVFTSKESGKEFVVEYNTPGVYTKTVFSDQYYLTKYEDELDWGSISEGDFIRLRSQVWDLVKGNEPDFDKVDLVVTMAGSGRKGTCPKPFETDKIVPYSFDDNDEDKEIKNCYKTLYSIYSQYLD